MPLWGSERRSPRLKKKSAEVSRASPKNKIGAKNRFAADIETPPLATPGTPGPENPVLSGRARDYRLLETRNFPI